MRGPRHAKVRAAMPLHIIKLCVGAESVEDLDQWIRLRLLDLAAAGLEPEQTHTTRMYPKRAAEIVGEGSLYWVIKGVVQVRQRIVDIRPAKGADGIERCDIVLDPELVRTEPRAHRPFQGWRYLADKDVPPDLRRITGAEDMHPEMRRALAELALI
ncbi:hypothetical protein OHA_1_01393 [Pleomorphomonas sp. SM30]|uniref:DUF1489 family protein n=2 Tax=Oharaeibacter diazotrophicus TaxID=1920512 RepID=A0A4R6RIC0_9HYPH|nr:hypothetical protein EDD54_0118 [Oharaeibacter diazotrophicus]BBE71810.1 hypothetical protein OHA_1_01393 [Pleomorphomonas sp. SM30]